MIPRFDHTDFTAAQLAAAKQSQGLTITVALPAKDEATTIGSIIGQMRNNFNVSVAEVGSNDIYQRAMIGFALVGNNRAVINSKIDKIFNLVDELNLAEIIGSEMEIINI